MRTPISFKQAVPLMKTDMMPSLKMKMHSGIFMPVCMYTLRHHVAVFIATADDRRSVGHNIRDM